VTVGVSEVSELCGVQIRLQLSPTRGKTELLGEEETGTDNVALYRNYKMHIIRCDNTAEHTIKIRKRINEGSQ
jgi:hypothetical protein